MRNPDFDQNWSPTCSLDMLRIRATAKSFLRLLFSEQNFLEVDTPCLSSESVIDAHLDPITLELTSNGQHYLQTSPEAHMKRLLAHGASNIFQFSHAFRAGELGSKHNPEFTMLEWYQLNSDVPEQITWTQTCVQKSVTHLAQHQHRLPLSEEAFLQIKRSVAKPTKARYSVLFNEFASLDPLTATAQDCRRTATRYNLTLPPEMESSSTDDWLNLLWSSLVEPQLAKLGMIFVTHFPATQAALARLTPDDPQTAERFELYLDGLEICNGYHELTDPDELARRMQHQQALRASLGKPPLTPPSRLIAAQHHHLPDCAGVALGFDRLLMWITGAKSIQQVLPFPWPAA